MTPDFSHAIAISAGDRQLLKLAMDKILSALTDADARRYFLEGRQHEVAYFLLRVKLRDVFKHENPLLNGEVESIIDLTLAQVMHAANAKHTAAFIEPNRITLDYVVNVGKALMVSRSHEGYPAFIKQTFADKSVEITQYWEKIWRKVAQKQDGTTKNEIVIPISKTPSLAVRRCVQKKLLDWVYGTQTEWRSANLSALFKVEFGDLRIKQVASTMGRTETSLKAAISQARIQLATAVAGCFKKEL